jgi:hypothetical protein
VGPFLWLLLFTLIVNSLCPLLARTTIISANKSISSSDTGEAFVDDTSLGCTTLIPYEGTTDQYLPKSEENVRENLQLLGQQWERLLFATGGALCVEKSFWYMMSWNWNKALYTKTHFWK